jgi:hypothetical protein
MCLVFVVDWSPGAVISNRDNQIAWRKICASPLNILLVRVLNSKHIFHRLSKETTLRPAAMTIKHKYGTISSLNSYVQHEPLGFIWHATSGKLNRGLSVEVIDLCSAVDISYYADDS